jgi:hypothetical protein
MSKFAELFESNEFVVKCFSGKKFYGYLAGFKQGSRLYSDQISKAEKFKSAEEADSEGDGWMDSFTKAGADYHVLDAKTGKRIL